jgi:hypothetical protein
MYMYAYICSGGALAGWLFVLVVALDLLLLQLLEWWDPAQGIERAVQQPRAATHTGGSESLMHTHSHAHSHSHSTGEAEAKLRQD